MEPTEATPEATSEATPGAEPAEAPQTPPPSGPTYATGRRKSAVARVWIREGSGTVTINGRKSDEYFPRFTHRAFLDQPFVVADRVGRYDVVATVRGGGQTGQAVAIRHGVSRALALREPDLRAPLKKAGLLTRDAREKERKKYGQPGARKRYQYSKR